MVHEGSDLKIEMIEGHKIKKFKGRALFDPFNIFFRAVLGSFLSSERAYKFIMVPHC
jgi:hypothetical protein